MEKIKKIWKEFKEIVKKNWLIVLTLGLSWIVKKLKEPSKNEEVIVEKKVIQERG